MTPVALDDSFAEAEIFNETYKLAAKTEETQDESHGDNDDEVRQDEPSSEEDDEIEGIRVKLDEDEHELDDGGVEMLMQGTEERNEHEEFQLQMGKEYFTKGMNYWTNCELNDAMREFAAALEIREDICGRKDSETAKCYMWVGTVNFLKEEYQKALDDFYRSFRIQFELKGSKDACHVVVNWINKSITALGLRSDSDKDAHWEKLMTVVEHEKKGDDMRENEKYDRAIEHFRSALKLEYMRRQINPNAPARSLADCGDLYYKIARCYHLDGKLDRAMAEYRQSLNVYMSRFGQNHRHTVLTMERMEEAMTEMGYQETLVEAYVQKIPQSMRHEQTGDWIMDVSKDAAKALKEYEAALEIEGQTVARNQVACGLLYFKIAKVHAHLKHPSSQILSFACRSAGILEAVLGQQDKHTSAALKVVTAIMSQTTAPSTPRTPSAAL